MIATRAATDATFTLALESPNQPEVSALIDALDAYQKPLYPAASHHGIDMDALSAPGVLFVVARDGGGGAVGCAAMVLLPDYAEVKRMYVPPQSRGSGAGRAMLQFLEEQAMQRGQRTFRLETGYLQGEALRFYERAGYMRRGPFGAYVEDPNSVFMEKRKRLGLGAL
jgi:putative acetyltransferase